MAQPRAIVVQRLLPVGRAYLGLGCEKAATAHGEATGLAMQPVQLVEPEGLEADLLGIAQDIVQAEGVGLFQPHRLGLAVGGRGAGKPDILADAIGHGKEPILEVRR